MDSMPSPKKESNGDEQRDVDLIDPDDPEYQREAMRPPDVKEDVKMMDQRKRVNKILNSEAFREELEDLIDVQLQSGGPQTPGLMALRQLSDLIGTRNNSCRGMAQGPGVIPINDIRGTDVGLYSRNERILRCKLAALYRLLDINGWTHGIFNHISLAAGRDGDTPVFFLNPFGLLYSEVTAASLVKIDSQGNVLDPGNTSLGVNRAGWNLHSAVHLARPDLKCLIHVHTPNIVAVSANKHGLLLGLSQESMHLYPVTYHTYRGVVVDPEERESIANDIGPTSKVLILRNHGVLVGGSSIEDAFQMLTNTMAAVDTQVRLGPHIDPEDLILASEEDAKRVTETTKKSVTEGISFGADDSAIRGYGPGELEFEALMRQLDNAGYRTGYPYRNPMVRGEMSHERRNDVEVPPASTSSSILYADDEERAKIATAQRLMQERSRSHHRTEWLSTPNAYHKVEVEETGTPNPRKFTRWVPDKEGEKPNSGTATPVRSANQFAPQGENPREFKENQKKIRSKYFQDARSAGPQSKVLDGVTEQEARKLVEEGRAKISSHNPQTVIVGAASMGIIQKEHRENAVVYHNVYSPNPFDKVTDEDLSQYHRQVQAQNNPSSIKEEEEDERTPQGETEVDATESAVEELTLSTEREATLTHTEDETEETSDAAGVMRLSAEMTSSMTKSLEDEPTISVSEPSPPAADAPDQRGSVLSDTLRSEASGAGDTTSQDESHASVSKDEKKHKKQKKGFRMPSFSKKKEKK